MILVGPRFGDNVNDAVARSAHFGGKAAGGDLKFLNGVLGKVGECATYDFVVVVAAVHGDIAAAAKAAGGANFKRVGLGGVECWRGPIAGNRDKPVPESSDRSRGMVSMVLEVISPWIMDWVRSTVAVEALTRTVGAGGGHREPAVDG